MHLLLKQALSTLLGDAKIVVPRTLEETQM